MNLGGDPPRFVAGDRALAFGARCCADVFLDVLVEVGIPTTIKNIRNVGKGSSPSRRVYWASLRLEPVEQFAVLADHLILNTPRLLVDRLPHLLTSV